ncbi:hypothetical protein [Bacillus suaedaesalsae]|uniref:YhfM-like domain-containing protein n=1 Tax=Bacillus suaedaesalsae TaxID=2810349 RepID=A0ABS2DHP1_9BACI|nr:hypothetical protein [Bacillus suaedaesalsae]MBM6618006.1 hypothetical protein [Bacillus suaedaesalsae]
MVRVILVFTVFFLMVACSTDQVKEVVIQELSNNSNSKVVLTDTTDIEAIIHAIDSAVKEPGIVNMMDAPFMISMEEVSYFLWIDTNEESVWAIMDMKDTHTLYTLTESSTNEMKKLFLKNQIVY